MGFSIHHITTDYTQTLAEYAYNLSYEQLPPEVVERAKAIMVQTIGVALAADGVPMSKKALHLGKCFNGLGGDATAWISGDKLSMANAAFVNGSLSDMLDWEDCSWTGHPAAGVIPVAWVTAEAQKRSGKELITAIVAAYEVYQRIAMAVQDPQKQESGLGWGLVSWQIFAAIIPACKLLGLNAEQINQAIGFGTSCSTIPASLHHTTMSDAYHYEHGFRAQSGVCIAQAVEAGVINYMESLDDPTAYAVHMTDVERPDWYTKELGKRYLIMTTLLKHWPANMWVQTPIELAHNIVSKNDIKPEEIKEIILDPPTMFRMAVSPTGYTSLTHAQFSIPFVIAAMIYDPVPGPHWYTVKNMTDPKVLALAAKVRGGDSKPHTLRGSFKLMQDGSFPMKTLRIATVDGRVFEESMDCHPGHPNNMMDRAALSDRFRIQATTAVGAQKVELALQALWQIEQYDDIASVSAYLHK